jgi:tetratricopeptide (TPR) repeat protein
VARRWEEARQQYEAATKAQPDSAEGHYNLGLTLQYLREREKMKTHFIEAANLAPGHKKIWDSPALRRYGDVPDKKQEATSAPAGGGLGSVFGGGGAMGTGGGRDN